ncbi:amino acid permease [Candidatus Neptunichlamydia sp. REUL1]|uniref:amino acid permease n=1 Tax=Candidatus Neptunichlamydia sp. REUL1 TaxID=3064277 RepID=UPI0029302023|nr:aromatic amino acid transport family protein [Candidatus Neptunochlamydia sp. REUL1]
MKINHYVGGVLLVAGTTIGAGMLALPVMSSFVGFMPSIAIFLLCWGVMLATAFFFLDANFAVEGEPNLISMVHKTLGGWGKGLSWIVYLLLLYSLTAAYISASSPLFVSAVQYVTGYTMPHWLGPFCLPLIFGFFVYLGTLGVDMINRILMLGLCVSYLLLVGFLPEHIDGALLTRVDWDPTLMIFPVVITSFGYHIIIPSLTTYMNHDKKKLRWILVVGSLLPLVIYLLWQVLILGIVPLSGENGLVHAWQHGASATQPLTQIVTNPWIKLGAHFFSFFAIVTSFLGVTLSLSDFLTDGFKIKKSWEGRLMACLLTFIPPLIFVLTYQRGFFVALEYAGAFVAILLIFLPAMMAWKLKKPRFYSTVWGRTLLVFIIFFAFFIVVVDVLAQLGIFKHLISKYLGHV